MHHSPRKTKRHLGLWVTRWTFVIGIAAGLAGSVLPHFWERSLWGSVELFGWPVPCVERHPFTIALYPPEEAPAAIEELWVTGAVGPWDDYRWGWILMRIGWGWVIAVSAYGPLANMALGCLLVALIQRIRLAWRRRHDPRFLPGHCPACGYDLTGNTSGRCPECGGV